MTPTRAVGAFPSDATIIGAFVEDSYRTQVLIHTPFRRPSPTMLQISELHLDNGVETRDAHLMETRIWSAVTSLVFLASGLAVVFDPPPTGCRLKIINTSTSTGNPDYSTTTCEGECVAPNNNPCKVSAYIGNYSSFHCTCAGGPISTESTQGCDATFSNQTGTWTINCFKRACTADCLTAGIPGPGETVWACTCPDA